jgi:hypothetical protein
MFMPRSGYLDGSGGFARPDSPEGGVSRSLVAVSASTPTAPAAPRAVAPLAQPPTRRSRWSGDTWTLLRHDVGRTRSQGSLPAVYGASQTGAVLRYRLLQASRRRLSVYLRGTAALGMAQETSAALGLSARPLPAVPVVAALEGRMTDEGGGRRFQPAAFAYTELPPMALPLGLRAETYVQAGYVGGEFATPFADGQTRLDRRLLELGRGEVRLGGGLWAGVQKGAGRVDAGPSAFVAVPLGRHVFSRIALDWRFRVAGGAEPGSGPAVTLSAGF